MQTNNTTLRKNVLTHILQNRYIYPEYEGMSESNILSLVFSQSAKEGNYKVSNHKNLLANIFMVCMIGLCVLSFAYAIAYDLQSAHESLTSFALCAGCN